MSCRRGRPVWSRMNRKLTGRIATLVFVAAVLFPPADALSVTAQDYFVEALTAGDTDKCRELIPEIEDYDRITIQGREYALLDRVARKGMWNSSPY